MADDAVIIEIRAEMAGLSKDLKEAQKTLKSFAKKTETENKSMKKGFVDLKQSISTALGVSLSNVLSSATRAITDFTKQGISDFLTYEQQVQGLKIQVGDLSDTLISDLHKATKGMVSDLNLISGANRALSLGIKKEALPALAETATALGKIQGLSPEVAFDNIVTGIGRASPLILDNLGIILKASDGYTDLSDKVELTNAVIEKSKRTVEAFNGVGETHIDQINRLAAAWENLKKSSGEFIVDTYDDLVFLLKDTDQQLIEVNQDLKEQDKLLEGIQTNWKGVTDEIKSLNSEIDGYKGRIRDITGEQTEKEIQAQRELNELKVKELKIRSAVKETSDGGFEITDREKFNQLQQEGIEFNSQTLDQIQARKDELSNEIELEQALKQVEYDKGIIRAENGKLIDKEGTTIEGIKNAVNTEFEILKKTKLKLDEKLGVEKDLVDMAIEEQKYRDEIEKGIRRENYELNKGVELRKKQVALEYAQKYGDPLMVGIAMDKLNKQLEKDAVAGAAYAEPMQGFPSILNTPSTTNYGPISEGYSSSGSVQLPVTNIFNIENINGTDPDQMAEALQEKLEILI